VSNKLRVRRLGAAAGILAVLTLGVWARWHLQGARAELEAGRRQLSEIQALLKAAGSDPKAPLPLDRADQGQQGIGAALQRAASESGMGNQSIQSLKASEGREGSEGGLFRTYRARLSGVAAEPLIRFIYALGAHEGLRAVELEMTRESGQARQWSVSLMLVKAT